MFLMMIPICSASFMKFDELWKNVEISWYFKCTVGIFLWNKSTCLNGLKFHMHVSDDDSNMFCKFDKKWWILKKCWNLMIFLGRALSAFFFEISQPLWKGSNFTCMFLMMIQICSASLMKFDELWKNAEISWYFKGPALSAFFYERSQLLRMGSNFTCMFLMMIQICSASLRKFGEFWKKMLKFHDISRAGTVSIFLWKIKLLWKGSNFTCMFLMMIQICFASLIKVGELWKNVEISWYF